jgi:hypothetical protein
VTSRGLPTVDHRHLDVRLGYQRIGEGKAVCTRPYNQIIGADEYVSPYSAPKARSFFSAGGQ